MDSPPESSHPGYNWIGKLKMKYVTKLPSWKLTLTFQSKCSITFISAVCLHSSGVCLHILFCSLHWIFGSITYCSNDGTRKNKIQSESYWLPKKIASIVRFCEGKKTKQRNSKIYYVRLEISPQKIPKIDFYELFGLDFFKFFARKD